MTFRLIQSPSDPTQYIVRPILGDWFRIRADPSGEYIYAGPANGPPFTLNLPDGQTPVFELIPPRSQGF